MKKLFLIFVFAITAVDATADCVATSQSYVSCKPGYYMGGNVLTKTCTKCPVIGANSSGTDISGTSPDYNTGNITSCYARSGTYNDDTGTFEISQNCNYTTTN